MTAEHVSLIVAVAALLFALFTFWRAVQTNRRIRAINKETEALLAEAARLTRETHGDDRRGSP